MRRTVSIFFLLCFAWVQAAAAACAVSRGGAEAHAADSIAHASHSAHGSHGGHAGHGPAGEPSHQHDDASIDCGMRIPCGALAIPTAQAGMARAPLIVFRSPLGEPDLYASPSLSADPPPPRASILS
jgi:hypothetical protein